LTSQDSYDYELAIRLTALFPRELVNELMPMIVKNYVTYAKGTILVDFKDSRTSRAFASFSMGSVQTWRVFEQCLDAFAYFMPSSGNLTSNGSLLEIMPLS
jgi:hypothetical protein